MARGKQANIDHAAEQPPCPGLACLPEARPELLTQTAERQGYGLAIADARRQATGERRGGAGESIRPRMGRTKPHQGGIDGRARPAKPDAAEVAGVGRPSMEFGVVCVSLIVVLRLKPSYVYARFRVVGGL